jgi:hypothetical protein
MKTLLFIGLLCGVISGAMAQDIPTTSKFSLGAELTIPVGQNGSPYSAGFGASAKYDAPVAKSTFFTASAGYIKFNYSNDIKAVAKQENVKLLPAPGFIPLKVGIKYYVNDAFGFFFEGQAGAAISTKSGYGTSFAYAPGLGYTFAENIEGSGRYEIWSHNGSLSQFAFRLAYRF